jgi:signal transduction histidine kinase
MTINYKQRLFLCFFIIFTLFAAGILFLEQSRERRHKTEVFEERLDVYTNIIDASLTLYPEKSIPDSLLKLLPRNIRLTLIDKQGKVLYDNAVVEHGKMDNHALRPEIIAAGEKENGRYIRISTSNETKYLYYAKRFNDYYIRVALPYDIDVRHFLKPDNILLYYIIALLLVMLALIGVVSGQFGKSIRQLRDFALSIEDGELKIEKDNRSPFSVLNSQFPKDELGEIGSKIAENYWKLQERKKEITLEREKLLQHVYSSEEGLCFFSPTNSVEFYNGLFIQYLNTITDAAGSDPASVLTDIYFDKISSFLLNHPANENYFETKIDKQGKNFTVRVNIFDDKSFEVIINDVTKQEKTRRMKQEMTGNITHELRAPVTGIRGCLETVLEHRLTPEKERHFIKIAYEQVLTLSELIRDMSLITKIEEAPQSFKSENVPVNDLLETLKNDMEIALQEKNIVMDWNIAADVIVRGNRDLLYSIFRNLTDNVIRYAGKNVNIFIHKFNEDKDFYYFSYSDNGTAIPDEHLNRLFERFYRINEGGTRDTGGSGLGLSIVKNAVAFHKGTIVAKNKPGGGMDFLFKLQKS